MINKVGTYLRFQIIVETNCLFVCLWGRKYVDTTVSPNSKPLFDSTADSDPDPQNNFMKAEILAEGNERSRALSLITIFHVGELIIMNSCRFALLQRGWRSGQRYDGSGKKRPFRPLSIRTC